PIFPGDAHQAIAAYYNPTLVPTQITIRDLGTGEEISRASSLERIDSLRFSPGGRSFQASVSIPGVVASRIRSWDTFTGQPLGPAIEFDGS
ncbi:MAG: hypothetical protein GWO24_37345, partial [Akkermansiaceae bacterium]|nr:hypothetical protein [Akkermansiaceae bacterium]